MARNRRARFDYDIIETFECGIVLQGSEIKSLRAGQCSLSNAYGAVDGGEMWLIGAHIAPYEQGGAYGAHDPDRKRKLLLHRAEIDELAGKVERASLTLVPLAIYLKQGRAKVSLALARGKRMWDKRQAIQERDESREAARELAHRLINNHAISPAR